MLFQDRLFNYGVFPDFAGHHVDSLGDAELNGLGRGSKECGIACPENFSPVCGTDGKTYSNECFLSLEACQTGANLKVKTSGPCNGPLQEDQRESQGEKVRMHKTLYTLTQIFCTRST